MDLKARDAFRAPACTGMPPQAPGCTVFPGQTRPDGDVRDCSARLAWPRGRALRGMSGDRADCGTPVKKTAAKGHTRKHAHATAKHHKTAKHHPVHHHRIATAHGHQVHTKAKHPAHAKAKGLALVPGDVACCVSEALGASLRLQGLPVTTQDVLALHRAAGADDERGAPVWAVLEAASEHGLAGVRLRFAQGNERDFAAPLPANGHAGHGGCLDVTGVLLGLDLPGPHAVLATPEGWWSWGELWCPCEFPDAVIEEAWAVSWAVAA